MRLEMAKMEECNPATWCGLQLQICQGLKFKTILSNVAHHGNYSCHTYMLCFLLANSNIINTNLSKITLQGNYSCCKYNCHLLADSNMTTGKDSLQCD